MHKLTTSVESRCVAMYTLVTLGYSGHVECECDVLCMSGFNPRGGGRRGANAQGFQLPPQAYDTINNPSPALPNVPPPPPKFLQLLILPPQGHMSRLNPACCICLACVAKSLSGFELNP